MKFTIPTEEDIKYLNEELTKKNAQERLVWAAKTFTPGIAVSSSFQTQSVPLLHLVSQSCPELPVIFIDTGFHFPETLAFRDMLKEKFHLNIHIIHPTITKEQLILDYGTELYRRDPDLCCYINKIEPMQRATAQYQVLVAGVRHDQTKHRNALRVIERRFSGPVRIHPIIDWSENDILQYITEHNLPAHPLTAQGYTSIGCAPCTQPTSRETTDKRAGRWTGKEKTECGLQIDFDKKQIGAGE